MYKHIHIQTHWAGLENEANKLTHTHKLYVHQSLVAICIYHSILSVVVSEDTTAMLAVLNSVPRTSFHLENYTNTKYIL